MKHAEIKQAIEYYKKELEVLKRCKPYFNTIDEAITHREDYIKSLQDEIAEDQKNDREYFAAIERRREGQEK